MSAEKSAADLLRSYIRNKTPFGDQLAEIAKSAVQECQDQSAYAAKNILWFDFKGNGVAERTNPEAEGSQQVRCAAFGDRGGFKLSKHTPAAGGKSNEFVLSVERTADGKTKLSLSKTSSQSGDAQAVAVALDLGGGKKASEVTLEDGAALPADLYQYIDASVLDELRPEGQFRSYAALFGTMRAKNYISRKIIELTTQSMRDSLRAELQEKNISTLRGTGYSPNVAHYGENFHNTARKEFMAAVFQLTEEGGLYLDGYCGFIQNAAEYYGACIYAYQDAKTGLVYRGNPHGNDAFTVDEKATLIEITKSTATAGLYERALKYLPSAVKDQFGMIKAQQHAKKRVIKTELDKLGHAQVVRGEDGAIVIEESDQRSVWAERDFKPLTIDWVAQSGVETALSASGNRFQSIAALQSVMIHDAAGKPVLAPKGMKLVGYSTAENVYQDLAVGNAGLLSESGMSLYAENLAKFSQRMAAGAVTQLKFERRLEQALEHECAVLEKNGRFVAQSDQTADKRVLKGDGQAVTTTDSLLLNVQLNRKQLAEMASQAEAISACTFSFHSVERYAQVPVFMEHGDEFLLMRQGDDMARLPTGQLDKFRKLNHQKIEADRTEAKRLKEVIANTETNAEDKAAALVVLQTLRQEIRAQKEYQHPKSDVSKPLVYAYKSIKGATYGDILDTLKVSADAVHSQQALIPAGSANPQFSFTGRSASDALLANPVRKNHADSTVGAEFVTVYSAKEGTYDRYIGAAADRENIMLQTAELSKGAVTTGTLMQAHADMLQDEGGYEYDEDGNPVLELDEAGQGVFDAEGVPRYKLHKWSPYRPAEIENSQAHVISEGVRAGNKEAFENGAYTKIRDDFVGGILERSHANAEKRSDVLTGAKAKLKPVPQDIREEQETRDILHLEELRDAVAESMATKPKVKPQVPTPEEGLTPIAPTLRTNVHKSEVHKSEVHKPEKLVIASRRSGSSLTAKKKPKTPLKSLLKKIQSGEASAAARLERTAGAKKNKRASKEKTQKTKLTINPNTHLQQFWRKRQQPLALGSLPKSLVGGSEAILEALHAAQAPVAATAAIFGAYPVLLMMIAAEQGLAAATQLDRNRKVEATLLRKLKRFEKVLANIDTLQKQIDNADSEAKKSALLEKHAKLVNTELRNIQAHLALLKSSSGDSKHSAAQASGYFSISSLDLLNSFDSALHFLAPATATLSQAIPFAGLTVIGALSTAKQAKEWLKTRSISPTVQAAFDENRGVDSSLRRGFYTFRGDKESLNLGSMLNWSFITTGSAALVAAKITALVSGAAVLGASGAALGLATGGIALVGIGVFAAFFIFGPWGGRFARTPASNDLLDHSFLNDNNRRNRANIASSNAAAYVKNGTEKMVESLGRSSSIKMKWASRVASVFPTLGNWYLERLLTQNAVQTQEYQLEMMKHVFQQVRDYSAFKRDELEKECTAWGESAVAEYCRENGLSSQEESSFRAAVKRISEEKELKLKDAQHYQKRLEVLDDKLHHGVEGIQMGVRPRNEAGEDIGWNKEAWDALRFEFLETLDFTTSVMSRKELKLCAEANPEFYATESVKSSKWWRFGSARLVSVRTPSRNSTLTDKQIASAYTEELDYFKSSKGGMDQRMAKAIAFTMGQKYTSSQRGLMHLVFEDLLEQTRLEKISVKAQSVSAKASKALPVEMKMSMPQAVPV
ncbi:MAG: hypothetical protein V4623_02875 [Pseudomonadota bacterium]